jgi:uncharacterized protein YecT (DUF1311 family)
MVGPSGKLLVQAQIGETADMQYEVDKAKREMAASQSASQQRSQAQHEAGDNQASNAGAGMVATEPTSAGRKSNSAEDKYSANYNRCMNSGEAAQGVTNALAQCLSDELTLQDVRLNTAYKAVMADLEPERQSSLRGAQRQWIKDRDSKCEAENQSGGTMDRLGRLSCHLDSTITRTEELQKMADQ